MYQDRRMMGGNSQYAGRYPRQNMAEEKKKEESVEEVDLQAEECGCESDCGCQKECDCSCNENNNCGGNNGILLLVLLLLFWN